MKYWRDEEYIGLGLSAHSYFEGRRFYNCSDINEYIGASDGIIHYSEGETSGIDKNEYLMLRLRLTEGVDLSEFRRIFGIDLLDGREELIRQLTEAGLAVLGEDRLALTEKGFYLSNSIISSILPD